MIKLRKRGKKAPEIMLSPMIDMMFLLLIFFMLTSTLVALNAIKLLLPSSNSKTMAKQTITVYINEDYNYFVDETQSDETQLMDLINSKIGTDTQATVVLRSDKSVPVQYIVNVIDAVNQINNATSNNHKVILATAPKK